MPFGGGDRIGGGADAGGGDGGGGVLRYWIVLHRGFVEEGCCDLLIALDAVAVIERDGVFDFGVGVVGKRGEAEQIDRLVHVPRHAAAALVQGAERILRFRIAGLRRDAQQFGGAVEILREQLPLDIEQRQIVRGERLAELCRLC